MRNPQRKNNDAARTLILAVLEFFTNLFPSPYGCRMQFPLMSVQNAIENKNM